MSNNAYLYRKLIPEYWFEQTENPQDFNSCDQYLDARIKDIPEGKSFIFITDPHCRDTNAMHSPAIIGYIREMAGIKKVVQGGDVVHREPNRYMGAQEIIKYNNIMRSVAGKDYLAIFGNHDINTANAPVDNVPHHRIPYTEIEKILFGHLEGRVCEDISERISYLDCPKEDREEILAFSRLHFHLDDKENKVRYIVVETGCQIEAERNGCVTKYFDVYNNQDLVMQYDWLYETLLSTPEDYDVVITGHALVGYGLDRTIPAGPLGLCRMVSGFQNCEKFVMENPFPNKPNLCKFYAAGEHTYDFSSRKVRTNVVIIAGDTHDDTQALADFDENGKWAYIAPYNNQPLSKTGVVVTTVQDDACESGPHAREGTHLMTRGTKTEQCFDVVTICKDGNIKLTRIGAGKDRFVNVK